MVRAPSTARATRIASGPSAGSRRRTAAGPRRSVTTAPSMPASASRTDGVEVRPGPGRGRGGAAPAWPAGARGCRGRRGRRRRPPRQIRSLGRDAAGRATSAGSRRTTNSAPRRSSLRFSAAWKIRSARSGGLASGRRPAQAANLVGMSSSRQRASLKAKASVPPAKTLISCAGVSTSRRARRRGSPWRGSRSGRGQGPAAASGPCTCSAQRAMSTGQASSPLRSTRKTVRRPSQSRWKLLIADSRSAVPGRPGRVDPARAPPGRASVPSSSTPDGDAAVLVGRQRRHPQRLQRRRAPGRAPACRGIGDDQVLDGVLEQVLRCATSGSNMAAEAEVEHPQDRLDQPPLGRAGTASGRPGWKQVAGPEPVDLEPQAVGVVGATA